MTRTPGPASSQRRRAFEENPRRERAAKTRERVMGAVDVFVGDDYFGFGLSGGGLHRRNAGGLA